MRVAVDFTGASSPRGGTWRYGIELTRALVRLLPRGSVRVPLLERLPSDLLSEIKATGARSRTDPVTSRVDVLDGMSRRRGRIIPWDRVLPIIYRPCVRRRLVSSAVAGCDIYHAATVCRVRPRVRAVVASLHDMIPALYPGSALMTEATHRAMVEGFQRRADLIIVPSQAVRDDVSRLTDLPDHRLRVVHYGIDHEVFRPDCKIPFDLLASCRLSRGRFFLFVGSLERRKNVERMIRAYLAAVPVSAGCPLVLAGAKAHELPSLDAVMARGEPRVRVIGYVSDAALAGLYVAARGVIHVALTEGFGFTPLEAMACGAPVVASRVGASAEVVGNAGLAVDPHSEEEITRAVHRLRTDDGLCDRLGKAGHERAGHFTWERCARHTLAVYREALAVAQERSPCGGLGGAA